MAALRFGSSSVDLISHVGSEIKITSLCAKGSWARVYDTSRETRQPNPQGEACATTARWEGPVLVSRMEGSPLGTVESARFMAGPSMVVKTTVRLASGRDAIMFWLFDRMLAVHERVTRGAHDTRAALLRQLEADHGRVRRATRRDNRYLQRVLLDWARWRSPADDFILVPTPSYVGRPSVARSAAGGAAAPRRPSPPRSPVSLSKSPSDVSLSALHAAQDAAARAAAQHAQRLADDAASEAPSASASACAAARPPGRLSPSTGAAPGLDNGSVDGGSVGAPVGPSRGAATRPVRAAPASIQLQLAHKLVEFCEGRGIASVVPLTSPNDTQEPQLLHMSPEQAEETAAKMAELEADMLLARQSHPVGWNCCGLIITRRTSQIPDYLRVWEMTLASP
ncbi:hypothetical protein QBZ16_001481 [Prototheca wickerhamii]|uniref:Uncharacterized protein n=1 Tax=Prototheca wickerhamii TaxID=3111 RepID=A0AAD9IFK9_PROWI|nr:hypothetical protein QBZ16_001481 [Prototheca wickerhamii]